MDLDYYLWRYRHKIKDFGASCDLTPPAITNILRRKHTPILIKAVMIHRQTGGLVGYHEMLKESDRKLLIEYLERFGYDGDIRMLEDLRGLHKTDEPKQI